MKTSATLVAAALAASASFADAKPAYVPGEVIVQLRERTSDSRRDAAIARAHSRILENVHASANASWSGDGGPAGLLRLSTTLSVEEAVAQLKRDPSVAFAEPNWLCKADAVADDTYYTGGSEWGAYGDDMPGATGPASTTNAFGTQAEKAWATGATGSRTVYVGIVDEGAQFAHPDLAANFWTNPFDPVDGRDNDGNGYVDDVHGWDFFDGDNTVYDGTGDDHGTHVAGTIGAVGGNGQGVAGMCWNVTMISTKFLGPDTGSIADAVKALDYLTDLKVRHGLNIVANNHSWSCDGYSQALNDAVLRAAKQGILTIAAAGNSTLDNDSAVVYPANFDTTRSTLTQSAAGYDAVISVAAIDRQGNIATYSDFGARSVDLGAPGTGIASTLPDSRYGVYSGTSMATPHVTGAAALIASARPGITAAALRQAILDAAIPTPSLSGKTVTGGRLNVGAGVFASRDVAVRSLQSPPSGARGSTVTVSVLVGNDGSATETFTVSMTDVPPAGGTSGRFSPSQGLTLAPGATATLAFTWTLAGSAGTHVATASASRVNGETDVTDNAASKSVTVIAGPAGRRLNPSLEPVSPDAAVAGAVADPSADTTTLRRMR